jgi:hypothetical protein
MQQVDESKVHKLTRGDLTVGYKKQTSSNPYSDV